MDQYQFNRVIQSQRPRDRTTFQQYLVYQDGSGRWWSGKPNNKLYLDTIQEIVEQQRDSKTRDGQPKKKQDLISRYNQVSASKKRPATTNEKKLDILYDYYTWLLGQPSRQKRQAIMDRAEQPDATLVQQRNKKIQKDRQNQKEQWEEILRICRVARVVYGVSWASLRDFFTDRGLPGVGNLDPIEKSLRDLYPYYMNLTGFISTDRLGKKTDQDMNKIKQLYQSKDSRYQQTWKQILRLREVKDQDLKYFSGGQRWKQQEEHLRRKVQKKKSWFEVEGLRPDVASLREHITDRLKKQNLQDLSKYVDVIESLDQFRAWHASLQTLSGLHHDENGRDEFEKLWRQVFLARQLYGDEIQSTDTLRVSFVSTGDTATVTATSSSPPAQGMEFEFKATFQTKTKNCGVTFDKDFPVIFKNLSFFGLWEGLGILLQEYVKNAVSKYTQKIRTFRDQFESQQKQSSVNDIYHTQDCRAVDTPQKLQVYQLQNKKMSPSTKKFLSGLKMWWMVNHFNFLPKKYLDELSVFDTKTINKKQYCQYKKNQNNRVDVNFNDVHIWDKDNKYIINDNSKSPEEFQTWVITNKAMWKEDIAKIRKFCDDYIQFLLDVSDTLLSYRQERPSRYKDFMSFFGWKNAHFINIPQGQKVKSELDKLMNEIFTGIPDASIDDVCIQFKRFDKIIITHFCKFFEGIRFSKKVEKQLKQQKQTKTVPVIVAHKLLHQARETIGNMNKLKDTIDVALKALMERAIPQVVGA